MMELNVDVIRDDEAFVALGSEWDVLASRAGIDHPFLRHDWVRAWWECFGAGKQLYLITVRSGETLIALAPLMRTRVRMYGLPVWRMEFIANVHTPRFDFIVAEGGDEGYAAILEHLRALAPRWDVIMLPELPETSRTLAVLKRLAESVSLRAGVWVAGASPRIPIPSTLDAFWASLSAKRRSTLRNRLHRLSELGELSLEIVEDAAQLPSALADGLRIEAAGWKGAAGTAIALDEVLTRFYAQVAEHAARSGTLRRMFLKVGQKRIAFGYCLQQARTLYLLKSGYDPEYAAYSPFNVLLLLAIQSSLQVGLDAIDLLGGSDPWKRAWTDQHVERRWLFLYRRTPIALVIYVLKTLLLPWLRRKRAELATSESGSGAPARATGKVLKAQS